METKGFFYFEIILNVLVSSFRFIQIPIRRAAGSQKDAYLRSLMLIYVHGHIKVYLKGNFVFFTMVPAVEQWLSANVVKIFMCWVYDH